MYINKNNKIISLLQNFIDNKLNSDNIEEAIRGLQPEDLTIEIKTYKYNSSIDVNVARRVINLQNFIYRTIEETIKRKLSKEEKEKLIIEFSISEGCTGESFDLTKILIEVLKNMPPEYTTLIIITVIIYFLINKYLDNKKFNDKEEKELEEQELYADVINNAINKLAENSLSSIIKEADKNNLRYLGEYERININGIEYTQEEINKIKSIRHPKEHKEEVIKTIKGNFKIIQINIKNKYIIVENNEGNINKIYYIEDLVSIIEDYKNKFKQAIDEEGKEFYIEATYFNKKQVTLYKIEEINNRT